MSRVRLALALVVALLASPLASAQAVVKRVGTIGSPGPESEAYAQTFRQALRSLGWVEGRNLIIDRRVSDLDQRNLSGRVDELIAQKPDVLVGWESVAQLMRARTSTIPIVLTGSVDPVKAGLAQSLSRPGMNVTGVSQLNDELPAKHIELVRELYPRARRIAIFDDASASGCRIVVEQARKAATRIGVEFVTYPVHDRASIEQAFEQMARQKPDALLPCPTPLLFGNRDLLFESVLRLRIPLSSFVTGTAPHGVLFAYAASMHDTYRRAAHYVDRILKGEKPGDLPIEQPTRFELVINLKTATGLGLSVPRSVLARADRVIE